MTDQVSGSSLPQTRDLQHHEQHAQQQQDQQPHIHFDNVDIESSQRHNDNDGSNNNNNNNDNNNNSNNSDNGNDDSDSTHEPSHQHWHQHNHKYHHRHHPHGRSPVLSQPFKRDTSDSGPDKTASASDVVVVVQTISVIQVVDSTGSTVIRTLPSDFAAAPVTGHQPESTAAASAAENASPGDLPETTSNRNNNNSGNAVVTPSLSSSPSPIVEDSSSSSSPSPSPSPSSSSSVTPSESSMPTSFPTFSFAPITSTHSSRVPLFPSLSGVSNSSFLFSAAANSTGSLHSFSTATGDSNFTFFGAIAASLHASVSTTFSAFGTGTGASTSTPGSSPTIAFSTTNSIFSPTSSSDGGDSSSTVVASSGNGGVLTPTSSAGAGGPNSNHGSGSGNTPAATIAGSVVGAISGLAFIVLLATVLLRWKKRQDSVKLIQGSGKERGYGGITGGGGGGGPAGAGAMSERRRSSTFAIPAALAGLADQSHFSKVSPVSDGAEKGFAKISGRRLPPVLQFGGDGYTDPRGSTNSEQSLDYRASHHFWGESPLTRLAVGSPMLSDTAMPILHASPARTAVPTSGPPSTNPFSDDNTLRSPTLSPLSPYSTQSPVHGPRRSQTSFSRFTENI